MSAAVLISTDPNGGTHWEQAPDLLVSSSLDRFELAYNDPVPSNAQFPYLRFLIHRNQPITGVGTTQTVTWVYGYTLMDGTVFTFPSGPFEGESHVVTTNGDQVTFSDRFALATDSFHILFNVTDITNVATGELTVVRGYYLPPPPPSAPPALITTTPDWQWDTSIAALIAKEDQSGHFVPNDEPWAIENINADYCILLSGNWWRDRSLVRLSLMKRGGTVQQRDGDTGVPLGTNKTDPNALHTVATADITVGHGIDTTRFGESDPLRMSLMQHNGIHYVMTFVGNIDRATTSSNAYIDVYVHQITMAGEASSLSFLATETLLTFPNNYYQTEGTIKTGMHEVNEVLTISDDASGNPRVLALGHRYDDQVVFGRSNHYTSDYFASVITFTRDVAGITHAETYFGNALMNGTSSRYAPILGADHINASTVGYFHIQSIDSNYYAQFLDLNTMTLLNASTALAGVPIPNSDRNNTSVNRFNTRIVVARTGPDVPFLTIYTYAVDTSRPRPPNFGTRTKATLYYYSMSPQSFDGPVYVSSQETPEQWPDLTSVDKTLHSKDGIFLGGDANTRFCRLPGVGKLLAIAVGYVEWYDNRNMDYYWYDTYTYEMTVNPNGSVTIDKPIALLARRSLLWLNGGGNVDAPQFAAFTSDAVGLIIDPTYWDFGSEPVAGGSTDYSGYNYHIDVLVMSRVVPVDGGGGSGPSAPSLLPPGPLWRNASLNARPGGASTKFKGAS